MTVCVAALCQGPFLVGASDRMLTAGDIQFEPPSSKIMPITNSIAVMTAGDAALQREILIAVFEDVQRRLDAAPAVWLPVRDVTDPYARRFHLARLKRAEASILAPLGLTVPDWLDKQGALSPQLVRDIATEMLAFKVPSVETLIVGADARGHHIYLALNGDVTCQDAIGFAAIGAGYWHANSQFMFAGHAPGKPVSETLLLTYSAKKRAEVAPGIGEGTDMFTIGPALGSYGQVPDDVITRLDQMYVTMRKKQQKAAHEANRKADRYVEEIAAAATAKVQAPIPVAEPGATDRETPADQTADRTEAASPAPAEFAPEVVRPAPKPAKP